MANGMGNVLKPDGSRLSNAEIYEQIMSQQGGLSQDVLNMPSALEGLNTAGDVAGRFGLGGDNVDRQFRPLRRILASSLNRGRGALASRMGANTAVPEAAFGALEGDFATASGNLESAAGGEKVQNDRMIASILENVLRSRDNFRLNRAGLGSQLLNSRATVAGAYMDRGDTDRAADGSTWDDIAAGVDLVGKVGSIPTGGKTNVASRLLKLF